MSEPWGPQQPYEQQQSARRRRRPVLAIAAVLGIVAAAVVVAIIAAIVFMGDDDNDTAASSATTTPTQWTARTETPSATATTAAKGAFTDLSQEDRIYVSVITKDFPELAGEPGGVAEDGHNICTWLDAGEAADSIKVSLGYEYGAAAANKMVTSAVVQFCAQHQIKLFQT